MARPSLQLTRKTFGSITVTGKGSRASYWLGICHLCSREREYRASDLNTGRTQGCGCKRTTHGMSSTLTYKRWMSMLARCRKLQISHDPRWDSFEAFYADLGECKQANWTLDRKVPYLRYGPENCRWADKLEQTSNRSNSRLLTIRQGKVVRQATAGEWARYLQQTTGRKVWTTSYLKTVMKGMELHEIVGAFVPSLWMTPFDLIQREADDEARARSTAIDAVVEEATKRLPAAQCAPQTTQD